MIDADIRKLDEQEPVSLLEGLEADIWARVAARATARKAVRRVALWQTAVMAVAMGGSIAAGLALAASSEPGSASLFTAAGLRLAPSHLLFDSSR